MLPAKWRPSVPSPLTLEWLGKVGGERAAWPLSGATYHVARKLGSGSFGAVFECVRESPWEAPVRVALKVSPRHADELPRELQMLLLLRANPHANVITLLEYWSLHCVESAARSTSICFVLPLYQLSLREWLEMTTAGSAIARISQTMCVGTDLAKGMAHLHHLGVAHRDLKPENVLMHHRGEISMECVSKIRRGLQQV
ncbi:hypothetical protein AB1Y20_022631 [Prymnesium parvum]|uniref:Protein kinase domain-containing protein n=1 Tax=Prymnesium parvum TaxID=97485 RepID=A0AB34JK39_PRYPA